MSSITSKKAALHSLGCKVNSYETDMMIQELKKAGVIIVPFDEKADIYIVNTCSVTNIADRKSRQMLGRARSLSPQAVVVASGCYVQGRADKVADGAPEGVPADIILGNEDKRNLVSVLEEYFDKRQAGEDSTAPESLVRISDIGAVKEYAHEEYLSDTSSHTRAYIKVEDGCDQFCSYCIIPYVRGRVRSREPGDILNEAALLARRGFKEIVLTGINLSAYGTGKGDRHLPGITDLMESLAGTEGLERIRLSSVEPRVLTRDFIRRTAAEGKICPHFHISLQSGCDRTLKRMNRKYTSGELYEAVCALREEFLKARGFYPALTADVIVGFPGESEEDFEECRAFLEKICFFETHVFRYSRRRGTVADRLEGQLTEAVKAERSRVLLQLSRENRAAYIRALENEESYTPSLLVEERIRLEGRDYWFGHTGEYVGAAVMSDEDLTGRILQGRISRVTKDGAESSGGRSICIIDRFEVK